VRAAVEASKEKGAEELCHWLTAQCSGNSEHMALGAELHRESPPPWEEDGSFLLLNPRLPESVRSRVLSADFPEASGRVWVATSGTGGTMKMVALSRRALEASARAVNTHLGSGHDDVWLNPLPLFHVGGLGILVRAALAGARWAPCGPWSAGAFIQRATDIEATLASLVPTQVHDLAQAGAKPPATLRAIVVGGGAIDAALLQSMRDRGWNLLPSYGLTEAASQVATAAVGANDFAWLPLLPHVEARLGEGGVVELRGDSLLEGWMVFRADGQTVWEDPKHDGWLRTGDRAELRGREIRVLGRTDDLIKIRGELVDIAALERALQARVPGGRVAMQVEHDERNGAVLRVAVDNDVAAREAEAARNEVFPPFARPERIVVGGAVTTALGKTRRHA
jgi:O-succinylbenzoic acid--CoA ligase